MNFLVQFCSVKASAHGTEKSQGQMPRYRKETFCFNLRQIFFIIFIIPNVS